MEMYLSDAQKRIISSENRGENTDINLISGTLEYENISTKAMSEAFLRVIEKNEILRTKVKKGEKKQTYVQFSNEFNYKKFSFLKMDNEEQYTYWLESVNKLNLSENDFLIKVYFVEIANKTKLFIQLHHILGDAWTVSLLVEAIEKEYNRGIKSDENEICQIDSYQYSDYIADENLYKESEKYKISKKFWKKYLSELKDVRQTSYYKSPKSKKSARQTIELDAKMQEKIEEYCNQNKLTLYSFFIGVLTKTISLFSKSNEVLVLNSIYNRNTPKIKKMMGMTVSTVPLKIKFENIDDLEINFQDVKKNLKEIYRHQRYPFNSIIQDLSATGVSILEKLEVFISYQNKEINSFAKDISWKNNEFQEFPLMIHINDRQNKGTATIDFDYFIDSYESHEISNIINVMIEVIEQIITSKQKDLSCLNNYLEIEIKGKSVKLNGLSIIHPFIENVKKFPKRTALRFFDDERRYTDVDNYSDKVASLITRKGFSAGDRVGVIMNRSFDMIYSILGILKAGGSYVPISPDYPKSRIAYIVKDSSLDIILTNVMGKDFGFPTTYISEDILNEQNKYSEYVTRDLNSETYVMYTSGSTGNPKGVIVNDEAVLNRLEWMITYFSFSERDNFLLKTAYIFDVSVWEIFTWYFTGSNLTILPTDWEKDSSLLMNELSAKRITRVHFVPVMLKHFLDFLKIQKIENKLYLSDVFCSGEELKAEYLHFSTKNSLMDGVKFHNLYGPTEATVEVASHSVDINRAYEQDKIPIGLPINNVTFYILGEDKKPVFRHEIGELYIAGICLSQGYLNREKENNQSFIFPEWNSKLRIYRTGDYVKSNSKGEIIYLGRKDKQIKRNGIRIDISEIESQILKIDGITNVSFEILDSNFLLCFIETRDKLLTSLTLREYLQLKLPVFMMPNDFYFVSKFPVTGSGKLDVNELLLTYTNFEKTNSFEVTETLTSLEKKIALIWESEFNKPIVSKNADFYTLGGDSLKAISILSKINNDFKLNISIEKFSRIVTLLDLSEVIKIELNEKTSNTENSSQIIKRSSRRK